MQKNKVDILLVGAGVMSSTLGMLLTHLDPSLRIMMVERLSKVASESTHSLNNAVTGMARSRIVQAVCALAGNFAQAFYHHDPERRIEV